MNESLLEGKGWNLSGYWTTLLSDLRILTKSIQKQKHTAQGSILTLVQDKWMFWTGKWKIHLLAQTDK